tara:strand:- start:150 stop:338 length:189 start_codon:yes stop_codon:yes gene_type:complete
MRLITVVQEYGFSLQAALVHRYYSCSAFKYDGLSMCSGDKFWRKIIEFGALVLVYFEHIQEA